jgi:hypothetical protein
MARVTKNSLISRAGPGAGHQSGGKKKADPFDPRHHEDDPYCDLRIPEEDQHDTTSDEYIWPEFDEDDEERV